MLSIQERMDQLAKSLGAHNGHNGILAPSLRGLSVSGAAQAANRCYIARFVPAIDLVAGRIRFIVGTPTGADDECSVGIYGTDFKRMATSGAVTGKLNATGVREVQFTPVKLERFVPYFAAFSSGAQGGSAGTMVFAQGQIANFYFIFLAAGALPTNSREAEFMNTAHPIPGTFTPGGGTAGVPLMAVMP